MTLESLWHGVAPFGFARRPAHQFDAIVTRFGGEPGDVESRGGWDWYMPTRQVSRHLLRHVDRLAAQCFEQVVDGCETEAVTVEPGGATRRSAVYLRATGQFSCCTTCKATSITKLPTSWTARWAIRSRSCTRPGLDCANCSRKMHAVRPGTNGMRQKRRLLTVIELDLLQTGM